MRVRMAGLIQKDGIYWFRMAVPERHRASIGKREILESFGTRDLLEAQPRHAAKLASTKALFARLDLEAQVDVCKQAEQICRTGFKALAHRRLNLRDDGVTTISDAEDGVLLALLTVLAFRVRCTWSKDHADLAELELMGECDTEARPEFAAAAVLDAAEQDHMVAKIKRMEGRWDTTSDREGREMRVHVGKPATRGLAYRELAQALLMRKDWKFVELEVVVVAEAAQTALVPGTQLYDAVAEEVLRKLATYRGYEAIGDTPAPLVATSPTQGLEARAQEIEISGKTLDDAYRRWCRERGVTLGANGRSDPPDKTADEWDTARRRFVELFGPVTLSAITGAMIEDYRDVLKELPSRPDKSIKRLPIREQADAAKAKGLKKLDPNSVKKHITAIGTMLSEAAKARWISENVARNVHIAGAGWTGGERDYFSLEDLRLIFSSPLMTDPDACSDTVFFIILLATLHGSRPGELAKLKPKEVCVIDDTLTIRVRVTEGRRQKTTPSIRDFPIHQIAIDSGIEELAKFRLENGDTWLFPDIIADKYGDRFKLLSRTINALLRGIGITEPDKSFYSTRHAHKRETRRKRLSEQNANQMHGHSTGKSVSDKYGGGTPIETLKEDIDQVEFRGVDWDPVIKCALKRISRLSSSVH